MKSLSGLLTISLLILCLNSTQLTAQTAQTLFDSDVRHGGFGGPVVKFSQVADQGSVWVGGRGGWIIVFDDSNSLSLGGGGYGLVTNHPADNTLDEDLYAMAGYGGFEFEYTYKSHRLLHFSMKNLIGGGGLMLRDRDFEEIDENVNNFFVFEPSLNAELNVTGFFRISAGAGYLFTSGINRFGFSDNDFSGLNANITLKFGSFL